MTHGAVLLNQGYHEWYCPNCGVSERTAPLPPNSWRYHTCAKLHNLTAPLVRAGDDAKVTAVERQDYLRDEIQTTGDDGKPYMAVRTDYADGHNDLVVHPGLAYIFHRRA